MIKGSSRYFDNLIRAIFNKPPEPEQQRDVSGKPKYFYDSFRYRSFFLQKRSEECAVCTENIIRQIIDNSYKVDCAGEEHLLFVLLTKIDDFIYLPKTLQSIISYHLKSAIRPIGSDKYNESLFATLKDKIMILTTKAEEAFNKNKLLTAARIAYPLISEIKRYNKQILEIPCFKSDWERNIVGLVNTDDSEPKTVLAKLEKYEQKIEDRLLAWEDTNDEEFAKYNEKHNNGRTLKRIWSGGKGTCQINGNKLNFYILNYSKQYALISSSDDISSQSAKGTFEFNCVDVPIEASFSIGTPSAEVLNEVSVQHLKVLTGNSHFYLLTFENDKISPKWYFYAMCKSLSYEHFIPTAELFVEQNQIPLNEMRQHKIEI